MRAEINGGRADAVTKRGFNDTLYAARMTAGTVLIRRSCGTRNAQGGSYRRSSMDRRTPASLSASLLHSQAARFGPHVTLVKTETRCHCRHNLGLANEVTHR